MGHVHPPIASIAYQTPTKNAFKYHISGKNKHIYHMFNVSNGESHQKELIFHSFPRFTRSPMAKIPLKPHQYPMKSICLWISWGIHSYPMKPI